MQEKLAAGEQQAACGMARMGSGGRTSEVRSPSLGRRSGGRAVPNGSRANCVARRRAGRDARGGGRADSAPRRAPNPATETARVARGAGHACGAVRAI